MDLDGSMDWLSDIAHIHHGQILYHRHIHLRSHPVRESLKGLLSIIIDRFISAQLWFKIVNSVLVKST